MIELNTGDIILIRGRRWRHRMAQKIRGCFWNHAVIYYKDDYTMEVCNRGLAQRRFQRDYARKQLCVLRHESVNNDSHGQTAERLMWVMRGMWKSNVKFDWLAFILEMMKLLRIRRPGQLLCDEFVERIYDGAQVCDIDLNDIMTHDYSAKHLRLSYGLVKVYDYRGESKC